MHIHIASKSLLSVQSGRVWVNFNIFKKNFPLFKEGKLSDTLFLYTLECCAQTNPSFT